MGRRLLISGRVQGINFRWFTKQVADELGIKGAVRNLPDGRVEVFADGELLDEFTEELVKGPPAAHVATVEQEQAPVQEDSFSIRH